MGKKWQFSLCVMLSACSMTHRAFSNDENIEIKRWSAALGAFQHIHADYLGSDDYEGFLTPHVDITYQWDSHNHYAFLRTHEGLGMQTRVGQGITGASIGFRAERDPEENSRLEGLTEVDETATANLFYRIGHNQWNGGIHISKGLTEENMGTIITLNAGCNCKLKDKWWGSMGIFANWADDTYMNDYFSVSASEATADRAEYEASSGWLNYGLSAGLSYVKDEHHSFMIGSRIYKLGNEAENSTFVDEEVGGSITIGYIYNF